MERGLNIIRADNSSGKSTCFQAIIYALGLDAMLTSRQAKLPLTPALSEHILDEKAEREVKVISSTVLLEVENGDENRSTVSRCIAGSSDNRLVRVFSDCGIDGVDSSTPAQEFFVRLPGAATSDVGFQNWLTKYLGWELPKVERFDGEKAQLYLEVIFPLFFVEQRFGWSRIQASLPTVFRIKDAARRATEYVLNLSRIKNELRRSSLQSEVERLQAEYAKVREALESTAAASEVVAKSMPPGPEALSVPEFLASSATGWVRIPDRISEINNRLTELNAERRGAIMNAKKASGAVASFREERDNLLARNREVTTQLSREAQELSALRSRSMSLNADIAKLNELRTLDSVGGDISKRIILDRCPTCWQPIADDVQPRGDGVMSLPETVAFMRSELALVRGSVEESNRAVNALTAEKSKIRARLGELDVALSAEQDGPQVAALFGLVEEEAGLRTELRRLSDFENRGSRFIESLNELAAKARAASEELKSIKTELSKEDMEKLDALEESFLTQEREYKFSSIPVEDLSISRETYRPSVDGFELGFQVSASDGIRTIWSYLFGLLETYRRFKGMHHIGLLMFDEPRQQSASKVSFGQLLRHASLAGIFGEQVIFFTSEESATVRHELRDCAYTLKTISGRLLKPA